ncbi:GtrA family protein [Caulobacter sp. S45]|uniref:GtrA family protein n=1 Tax=Caulobacter sp. S45 TaxID=1641861 RepID=UPI00131BE057|nr:GtrA family protein [Caulobacter sp. S45]
MRRYLPHILQLSRFGLAGALNTLVGLSIIAALDVGLHAPPALANAAGYAVGMLSGFLLNRRFVFRSQTRARSSGPKYLLAAVTGFVLNQLVLQTALHVLGPGAVQHMTAQLAGMGVYTVSTFLVCRFWVFREPAPALAA